MNFIMNLRACKLLKKLKYAPTNLSRKESLQGDCKEKIDDFIEFCGIACGAIFEALLVSLFLVVSFIAITIFFEMQGYSTSTNIFDFLLDLWEPIEVDLRT